MTETKIWILETGTDEEAMERSCLMACSTRFAQPAFLKNPGQPAQEWHRPQWAGVLSHQSLIKKTPHSQILRRYLLK